jgi:hypothetical protein
MMAYEDLGVLLGGVGIATGLASILYARVQAGQSRRQAEQATHMTLLAANQHVIQRLQATREQLGKSAILVEMQRAVPDLQGAIAAAGNWNDYILLREVTEIFQDAYFMRRDAIITDAYWTDLTGIASIWAKTPSFKTVFDYAVTRDLTHAEFVDSFRPVFAGQRWRDPKPAS